MNHSFHCHLRKSFRWYHNWHDHPLHQHAHWFAFIVILVLAGSFLSGQINIFDYESDRSEAQAQTTIQLAPILSSWSPTQSMHTCSPPGCNGWWPELSPDGRYVSYGNWGDNWVTDLQTSQNYDFSNPPGLPAGSTRCTGGKWKDLNTLTFVCEVNPFYILRYEVTVGQWQPVLTSDDPAIVAGNLFDARDGHWSSWLGAGGRIAKDNQTVVSSGAGGALAMSQDNVVYGCDGSHLEICLIEGSVQTTRFPTQAPLHQMSITDEYIIYGGYGPVRGICLSDGKDINLSATSGFTESLGGSGVRATKNILMVNGQPWIVTGVFNNTSSYIFLRPWGERASIAIPADASHISAVHNNGIFTVAYNDPVGRMAVVTISDSSPRNDLSGGLAPETCGSINNPPVITSLNPTVTSNGGTLEIVGSFLTPNVQFFGIGGTVINATGWVDPSLRVTTVIIPNNIQPGIYNVGVTGAYGSALSPSVITIDGGTTLSAVSVNPVVIPGATNFQDLITYAYNYSLIIVGIAVFIMIMWGGFLWMTSAANPGNIATAKGYMKNAIIGAVLLLSSYVILNTINPELVGGGFNLPGISNPPPPPIINPPPGGGGSASQASAQTLLSTIGLASFLTNATCSGYHAQLNIQEVAGGNLPSVCSPTCSCLPGGTTGSVNIDPIILDGLTDLWTSGSRFTVSSLTTGIHSAGSRHYQGRAVDIVVNSSSPATWLAALNYIASNYSGQIYCETASGASDLTCTPTSAGGNTDHIHWDF